MTSNNNKNVITNEIVQITQWFFSYGTFLPTIEVSLIFHILSSHANTNLTKRSFLHEQFLICKYSPNSHALS